MIDDTMTTTDRSGAKWKKVTWPILTYNPSWNDSGK